MNAPRGGDVYFYSFFNFGDIWGCVVNVTHRPPYPRDRDPERNVQGVGWASGPVWTGA